MTLERALSRLSGSRINLSSPTHDPKYDRIVGVRIGMGDYHHMVEPIDDLNIIIRAARLYLGEHGEPPAE